MPNILFLLLKFYHWHCVEAYGILQNKMARDEGLGFQFYKLQFTAESFVTYSQWHFISGASSDLSTYGALLHSTSS